MTDRRRRPDPASRGPQRKTRCSGSPRRSTLRPR